MVGIIYSTIAGISTVAGAILVIAFGKPRGKTLALLLGFAGGIMLAISIFELIWEALTLSGKLNSFAGFALGIAVMLLLTLIISKTQAEKRLGDNQLLKVGYLVLIGVALHNFPEGLAIGAGLEASTKLGALIAISIGIHNIPEGMATAGPLMAGGLSIPKIIMLTLLAGLMAPLGTIMSMLIFKISTQFIGSGLAFAAGAMLYIVCTELIPEAKKISVLYTSIGLSSGILIGVLLFSSF